MQIKKKIIGLYERMYPELRLWRLNRQYNYRIMSMEQTVSWIQKHKCSIARYGDGEFGLITRSNHPDFQKQNPELSERLAEVAATRDNRVLICIPHNFRTLKDCNQFAYDFWNWWLWNHDNLQKALDILRVKERKTRVFGDAQITRPYMDWKDKSKARGRFENIKDLWKGRDIVIVEGSMTRLGVGNDLLEDARQVKRIICPSHNAYDYYSEIMDVCKRQDKRDMLLLALGPTATVLAYDLAMEGFQALDIGHIDIEYEWFKSGATRKTIVQGKATQEAHRSEKKAETLADLEYENQIIVRIG